MDTSPKLSAYELMVRKNIQSNRQVLKSLGLLDDPDEPTKRSYEPKEKPRRQRKSNNPRQVIKQEDIKTPLRRIVTRRSSLLKTIDYDGLPDTCDVDENTPPSKKRKIHHEPEFGEIEGVEVGAWWMTRMECSAAGIHRPTVAGIHGRSDVGCYSIALSGGYEDDLDFGHCFTYTGSGGRDLKGTKSNPKNLRTAPQSKDQVMDGNNAALALNIETKQPVRVIRGYKLKSQFAPEEGYRYDGLYSVEKSWTATGLSGFIVCKFALKRLPDQDPPPWDNPLFLNKNKGKNGFTDEENVGSDSKTVTNSPQTVLATPCSPLQESNNSPSKSNENVNISDKEKDGIFRQPEPESVEFTKDNSVDDHPNLDIIKYTPMVEFSVKKPNKNSHTSPPTTNSVDKRVRFSPRVLCFEMSKDDDVWECGVVTLNGVTINANCDIEPNGIGDSTSENKRQASILKYFTPLRKKTENHPAKNTVNPKSLRSNRFSAFSSLPMETQSNFNGNSDISKPTVSTKRQMRHSKNYSLSIEMDSKFHTDATLPKTAPDMLQNLIKENNEKLRLHNELAAEKNRLSVIKPCSVNLFRLEESFCGWDDSIVFHGFSGNDIEIFQQKKGNFERIVKYYQNQQNLRTVSEDFRGFGCDDLRGSSGLVSIGFIINKLSES